MSSGVSRRSTWLDHLWPCKLGLFAVNLRNVTTTQQRIPQSFYRLPFTSEHAMSALKLDETCSLITNYKENYTKPWIPVIARPKISATRLESAAQRRDG